MKFRNNLRQLFIALHHLHFRQYDWAHTCSPSSFPLILIALDRAPGCFSVSLFCLSHQLLRPASGLFVSRVVIPWRPLNSPLAPLSDLARLLCYDSPAFIFPAGFLVSRLTSCQLSALLLLSNSLPLLCPPAFGLLIFLRFCCFALSQAALSPLGLCHRHCHSLFSFAVASLSLIGLTCCPRSLESLFPPTFTH